MKKIFLTLAVLLATVCTEAQVQEKMIVERYDGTTVEYDVADVKRVTFVKDEWLDYSDFKIETTHLQVPYTGGTFTVRFSSKNPVSFGPQNAVIEDSFYNSFYASDGETKGIAYEREISDNALTITVEKAEFGQTKTAAFPLVGKQGQELATIVVEQEGDPDFVQPSVLFGDDGKSLVNGMFLAFSNAYTKLWQLEINYRREYLPQFRPYETTDSNIAQTWQTFYQAINYLCTIKDYDAQKLSVYQDYLNAHLAIAYLGMLEYWGGVPYVTHKITAAEDAYNIPRLSKEEIIDDLIARLLASFDAFEETQINWPTNDSEFTTRAIQELDFIHQHFFLSKDIVRLLLAKLYMEKGDYASAKPLIEAVVANGRYVLTEGEVIKYGGGNSECIYGFVADRGTRAVTVQISYGMVLDYKDVLLDLAECCHHTADDAAALQYVNQLCSAKGIESAETGVLRRIADVRQKILSPYYLPFIRRNGLGESWLGMGASQTYQLLFPIPQNEVVLNSSLTQNPGYGGTRKPRFIPLIIYRCAVTIYRYTFNNI